MIRFLSTTWTTYFSLIRTPFPDLFVHLTPNSMHLPDFFVYLTNNSLYLIIAARITVGCKNKTLNLNTEPINKIAISSRPPQSPSRLRKTHRWNCPKNLNGKNHHRCPYLGPFTKQINWPQKIKTNFHMLCTRVCFVGVSGGECEGKEEGEDTIFWLCEWWKGLSFWPNPL